LYSWSNIVRIIKSRRTTNAEYKSENLKRRDHHFGDLGTDIKTDLKEVGFEG
jgi:hypothetical protein